VDCIRGFSACYSISLFIPVVIFSLICARSQLDFSPDSIYISTQSAGNVFAKEDSIKVEYRAVSCVFQNIDPPTPLHPASVSSSPATKVHTRWAERGVGGQIFWKTQDVGLASYSNNLSMVFATSLIMLC
jgi:hypothetical protein